LHELIEILPDLRLVLVSRRRIEHCRAQVPAGLRLLPEELPLLLLEPIVRALQLRHLVIIQVELLPYRPCDCLAYLLLHLRTRDRWLRTPRNSDTSSSCSSTAPTPSTWRIHGAALRGCHT